MTSEDDRRRLLQLARDAIVAHVTGAPMPATEPPEVFARPGGVFVTIHKRGDLRGCIGHIDATDPLGVVVPRSAVAACSSDPRFPGITPAELDAIDLELSLLGPLEPIAGPDEIDIGRHGLLVEKGWHRGLLLPQVATEWGWDAPMFLAQTCRKAGLPFDAWREGARIWRFDAEVFGER
ncbi:MAG TPA: AmmeMemoRadiSam system protein A [Vicinamibacterales bacterium]|nr:AmmeMemoRadiSam system protein A [Vicinamibacterales bacterium]